MYNVQEVIRIRARERSDAQGGHVTNKDAKQQSASFSGWLLSVKGVRDWRDLKPFKRATLYGEYRVGCVDAGIMYENPSLYGLQDFW